MQRRLSARVGPVEQERKERMVELEHADRDRLGFFDGPSGRKEWEEGVMRVRTEWCGKGREEVEDGIVVAVLDVSDAQDASSGYIDVEDRYRDMMHGREWAPTHPAELLVIMPPIQQQPLKHFQIPLDSRPAQRCQAVPIGVS